MYSVKRKNTLSLTRWRNTEVSCKSDQFIFEIVGKLVDVGN